MSISIGKRVYESLSKMVSEGLASSYLYLAMSAVFKDMGLNGCAKWMRIQSDEERARAMIVYDHILLRGHKIKFLPLPAPKQDWRAPLHIFEEMMRHEQKSTASLMAVYDYAMSDKDCQTLNFIQGLIESQIKEESTAASLLDRLQKMQGTDLGVILFDKELGERT